VEAVWGALAGGVFVSTGGVGGRSSVRSPATVPELRSRLCEARNWDNSSATEGELCGELPEIEDGRIESGSAAPPGPGGATSDASEVWNVRAGGCVVGCAVRLGSRASAHAREFRRLSKSALMPSGS